MSREEIWLREREYSPEELALARKILRAIREGANVSEAVRSHPLATGGYIAKHALVYAYRGLIESGEWPDQPEILRRIRMKPSRTLSGVTTVTVLTKPYPCPGQCIFCPDDDRMPKSYLADEPGAMRGLYHRYDPFAQVQARIQALDAIGHPTDKIELLILGGTWSAYRRDYQEWFIRRCLEAMNGFEAGSLFAAQNANQIGEHRNVGLAIETRPDYIDVSEVARLRRMGVTKVQMGAQSFDDRILELNRRGHSVADTRRAMRLLRAAGYKIVLHWMPNLLGASIASDRRDFARLWHDPDLRPDELKIYPCQLLPETQLHARYARGEFIPYTTEELIALISDLKPMIPPYCRVNRIVRDFPAQYVIAGNRRASLRQDIQRELRRRGERCQCIRCREVRGRRVEVADLKLDKLRYRAGGAQEHFLQYTTENGRLAGFVRLSLPGSDSPATGLSDLSRAAIVRELHVYGQSLEIGGAQKGAAQHRGLGERLMENAEAIAENAGYSRIAVIAALGTRRYYEKLGYRLGDSYMLKVLS